MDETNALQNTVRGTEQTPSTDWICVIHPEASGLISKPILSWGCFRDWTVKPNKSRCFLKTSVFKWMQTTINSQRCQRGECCNDFLLRVLWNYPLSINVFGHVYGLHCFCDLPIVCALSWKLNRHCRPHVEISIVRSVLLNSSWPRCSQEGVGYWIVCFLEAGWGGWCVRHWDADLTHSCGSGRRECGVQNMWITIFIFYACPRFERFVSFC